MTPRARIGGDSFSCGYCTVFGAVLERAHHRAERDAETLDADREPSASSHQTATFKIAVTTMLSERERDQHLPGEALQLILAEPGVA